MRFDPSDRFFPAPTARAAPATRLRRPRTVESAPPQSQLNYQPFPAWARLEPKTSDAASAAFFAAGASLSLLDGLLRQNPPCVGALRSRLALRAAAAGARVLRLREDEAALRDAEHLSPLGAPASPAARPHRPFRQFSTRPLRLDAETLGLAAELLELRTAESTLEGLSGALHEILARAASPRLAAAGGGRAVITVLADAAPFEAEILALWLADLTVAQKLGWKRPVPLLATAIAAPALRRRPQITRKGGRPCHRVDARRRLRRARARRAGGADLRSRRPPPVRSADRT